MIGTKLAGRYEIESELGRGGMGAVYRARDPLLGREVAVKLIPPMLLTPQSEERFRREAQLVAQMDHPSIVPIHDLGDHEGSLFFVMPIVHGRNLRQYMRERTRSIGDVLEIAIQVAEALDYSHQQGVVHRDVKPENIMVSDEGSGTRVRIMDFGLAKTNSDQRLTKTGALVGTVHYFSPEQVIARDVDNRSDIYSLGTVLYECLTGHTPFSGETQSILYRVVHEHPKSLRESGADVDEALDEIVRKSLAKEPARRYQRAAEMAEALRVYHSKLQASDREKSVVLSTVMTAQFQRPVVAPFIGREKEIVELQRRLNSATEGECQFAVIAGGSGIGKSRLVEEIENLARARKIRVLHGRFVEQDRTFSFQGFAEVIQEYFRAHESGHSSSEIADLSDLALELVRLFPVLGEVGALRAASSGSVAPDPGTSRTEDRTYVYELLARTLTRLGGGKPLVLVFDNLHGAAEVSIEALQYTIRRLGPTPTFVIGTYRQTEIDRGHPVTKLLDAFAGDPRFVSITLAAFSPSEHRQYLETIVGSSALVGGLAERLFQATDANPFFTRELVRSLMDSGGLVRDQSGSWSLSGGETDLGSAALPATIQQTVEKRIDRLPESEREVLSVAALLGKSFDNRDLETLLDGRSDLDDLIDKLIGDGMIEEERESRGDRLTFSSGIVRDVLYAALPRRRRRSLHRRYAEILEKRWEGRIDRIYPQLLHHLSEGDVADKTIAYGLEFAAKLLAAFSPQEAVHVIRTVLEFLQDEGGTGDPLREGEARMLLASAQKLIGDLEAASREAELAVHEFEEAGASSRRVAAMLFAAETAWQARKIEETTRWLDAGLELARKTGEHGALRDLLAAAVTVANLRGEYERAREFYEEADRLEKPATESSEEPLPTGGSIVVGVTSSIPAREPYEIAVNEEVDALGSVYETLVTTDEHGLFLPMLASQWEVLDDGHGLIFTIRPGVHFHDGTPLTADKIKEAFERSIRHRTQELSAAFAVIRGVEEFQTGSSSEVAGLVVRSENQLEIRITEPLPIYPALLADPAVAIAIQSASGSVVGTGPFRIASQTEERLHLERAESHWKEDRPHLDRIEFRRVDSADVLSALRRGEIDIGRDLPGADLEELLRDSRLRSGLVEAPKKTTYFVLFNAKSIAVDAGIRRALCGAVRPHDLVWRTVGRLAQPAVSLIPPGLLGHDPGRRRTYLNTEEATDLARAGGERRVLRAAVHPLFHTRYRSLCEELLRVWSEIGVDVTIVTPTQETYLDAFRDNGEIDLMIGRWNADFDDPDNFTAGLFHSRNGALAAWFASPETDLLLEQARVERRNTTRESLYRKFENDIVGGDHLLPLFHEIDYRIGSPRIRGLRLRSEAPYVDFTRVAQVADDPGLSPATLRQAGGVLVIPVMEDIDSLDPVNTFTIDRGTVISAVFETLTRVTGGARVVPSLAEEVRSEENGSRYRIILRGDVRFHDGRRLGARDVRYSWERYLTHAAHEIRWMLAGIRGADRLTRGESRELEGFRIVSAREFVVELTKPLAFFPAIISNPSMSIVPEGTRVPSEGTGALIGTGPFRVVRFDPRRSLELERNPGYWRPGFPRSERLVFKFQASSAQTREDLIAGRVSLASDLAPADVDALRMHPDFASASIESPRLSTYFAALNVNSGPLSDLQLRRTLTSAIDVPALVRRTVGRLAIPAHGFIPPGLLGYEPSLTRPSVTPPAPLKEPIELTVAVHPAFLGQYVAVYKEFVRLLAEKGFRLALRNQSMAEYTELEMTGATDISLGRWIADYPDADTFAYGMLHSTGGSLGRLCATGETDRLAERGRSEADPSIRHQLYAEIGQQVEKNALMIPLFHEQLVRFTRPEVKGLRIQFSLAEVAFEELYVAR